MYKAADVDARIASMKTEGRSKADIIDTASDMCIGWPYVFGAAGEMCTPDNRKKYAGYRPDKKPDIFGACPALSGKGTCDSCKWCGTRIFDCRGFTRWLLAQVGLTLYGGTVTAQWETASNWVYKGNIDKMPLSLACCVFREGHTGMHLFGDVTRHCNKYVKEQLLPGVPRWLRFGIPAGLYKTEELRKAGLNVDESKNIPTLRRGSRGDMVEELQALLNAKCGYDLEIDAVYGAKTESAVIAFQLANGLTADGICGPKTWRALGVNHFADVGKIIPDGASPPADVGADTIRPLPDASATDEESLPLEGKVGRVSGTDEVIAVPLADWQGIKAAIVAAYHIVKQYAGE